MVSLLFTLYLHTYAKVNICAHPGILCKLNFLFDILDFSSQRIIPSPKSRNYTSPPQWPTMVHGRQLGSRPRCRRFPWHVVIEEVTFLSCRHPGQLWLLLQPPQQLHPPSVVQLVLPEPFSSSTLGWSYTLMFWGEKSVSHRFHLWCMHITFPQNCCRYLFLERPDKPLEQFSCC